MKRLGLILSIGFFVLSGKAGAVGLQCASDGAPNEFFRYEPSLNGSAVPQWYIQEDRIAVEKPALSACAPRCAAPVREQASCYNPCLHGINGSLDVQPTIGIRGNNLIIQPTASLIGGNNPYLAPVVQNASGIIESPPARFLP